MEEVQMPQTLEEVRRWRRILLEEIDLQRDKLEQENREQFDRSLQVLREDVYREAARVMDEVAPSDQEEYANKLRRLVQQTGESFVLLAEQRSRHIWDKHQRQEQALWKCWRKWRENILKKGKDD